MVRKKKQTKQLHYRSVFSIIDPRYIQLVRKIVRPATYSLLSFLKHPSKSNSYSAVPFKMQV